MHSPNKQETLELRSLRKSDLKHLLRCSHQFLLLEKEQEKRVLWKWINGMSRTELANFLLTPTRYNQLDHLLLKSLVERRLFARTASKSQQQQQQQQKRSSSSSGRGRGRRTHNRYGALDYNDETAQEEEEEEEEEDSEDSDYTTRTRNNNNNNNNNNNKGRKTTTTTSSFTSSYRLKRTEEEQQEQEDHYDLLPFSPLPPFSPSLFLSLSSSENDNNNESTSSSSSSFSSPSVQPSSTTTTTTTTTETESSCFDLFDPILPLPSLLFVWNNKEEWDCECLFDGGKNCFLSCLETTIHN